MKHLFPALFLCVEKNNIRIISALYHVIFHPKILPLILQLCFNSPFFFLQLTSKLCKNKKKIRLGCNHWTLKMVEALTRGVLFFLTRIQVSPPPALWLTCKLTSIRITIGYKCQRIRILLDGPQSRAKKGGFIQYRCVNKIYARLESVPAGSTLPVFQRSFLLPC